MAELEEKYDLSLLMVILEVPKDTLLQGFDGDEVEDCMWYLDTSATSHMMGKRGLFHELKETLVTNIWFRDGLMI